MNQGNVILKDLGAKRTPLSPFALAGLIAAIAIPLMVPPLGFFGFIVLIPLLSCVLLVTIVVDLVRSRSGRLWLVFPVGAVAIYFAAIGHHQWRAKKVAAALGARELALHRDIRQLSPDTRAAIIVRPSSYNAHPFISEWDAGLVYEQDAGLTAMFVASETVCTHAYRLIEAGDLRFEGNLRFLGYAWHPGEGQCKIGVDAVMPAVATIVDFEGIKFVPPKYDGYVDVMGQKAFVQHVLITDPSGKTVKLTFGSISTYDASPMVYSTSLIDFPSSPGPIERVANVLGLKGTTRPEPIPDELAMKLISEGPHAAALRKKD